MVREINLREFEDVLDEVTYPITRRSAASYYDDVILVVPDNNENIGEAISELSAERFNSSGELEVEVLRRVAEGAVNDLDIRNG